MLGRWSSHSAGQGGVRTRGGGQWGLAGVPSLAPSPCSLPVTSTTKGMKTPLAARERALLPRFWENLNLSTFSNGEKKPFQPCLAKGVTVHLG